MPTSESGCSVNRSTSPFAFRLVPAVNLALPPEGSVELLSESWGRGLGRVLFRVAQSSTISSVVLGLLALSCKGQRNKR